MPRRLLQFTALTRLQELSLSHIEYEGKGYSALTRLPSLRRLRLFQVSHVPACLPRLSLLEALFVIEPFKGEDVVWAALPRLQRLRALLLSLPEGPDVSSQLASLTSLRSLALLEDTPGHLPAGPWLSSLQRLYVTANMCMASLPALAAAPRLELLGVDFSSPNAGPDLDGSQAAPTLAAALCLPALRRLAVLGLDDLFDQGSIAQAFEVARLYRPALRMQCLGFEAFMNELFDGCGFHMFVDTSREAFLGLDGALR